MTGQDLLNHMMILDNEMLLTSGEVDVTNGLRALNMSQDMFESVIATRPKLFGDTTGDVSISDATETTAFPSGVLRIDKLWMLDASTSRPLYPLNVIDATGGHAVSRRWPASLVAPQSSGRVTEYWTDGRKIYWSPFPGQDDTVRWYGFSPASDITAVGTFAYPDIAALPIAAFAVKLMSIGVGDETLDLDNVVGVFGGVVDALSRFNRDRAPGFSYTRVHTT